MERFMFLLDLCRKGYASTFSVEPAQMHDGVPLALTPEDVEKVKKEHDEIAVFYARALNNGEFIPFFVFNRILRSLVALYRRLYPCDAGNSYITINPDGDVYACHKEGQTAIGSLEKGFDASLRSEWHANTFIARNLCAACWARYICGGECRHDAIEYSGDAAVPCWSACELRRHWIQLCIWIMSELNERGRFTLKKGLRLHKAREPRQAPATRSQGGTVG
jgi:uncharacterized protein